ncbi:MAG: metallophosphoesterase family protein [Gemmatimonadota bacterium]
MPEILHISDLHFGPPFLADRAEAALELGRRRRPDVVVVSGDFTQRAKPRQYEAARDYVRRFEVPVVVTPGNHDIPLYRVFERLLRPYGNYTRHINEALDSVHRLPGLTLVCLNSSRPYVITNGRLGRRQLELARRAFDRSEGLEIRVVVTHHHLAPPPDFEGGNVMPRARRAIEAFTEMGVDLILAGHMHRAYIGDSLDFFPGGEREKGIVIVQCGTTTSARGRGRERLKNSLNVIRADDGRMRITHYLWRGPAEGFSPHSEHRFGVRPRSWLAEPA